MPAGRDYGHNGSGDSVNPVLIQGKVRDGNITLWEVLNEIKWILDNDTYSWRQQVAKIRPLFDFLLSEHGPLDEWLDKIGELKMLIETLENRNL